MTMDRSLKARVGLGGNRSVLSRDERIHRMIEEEKFDAEKNSPLGLVKTRVRHSKVGAKAKKAAEEKAEGEAGAAPAAAAAAAAAATKAPAKGAAPAGKAAKGKK